MAGIAGILTVPEGQFLERLALARQLGAGSQIY
jgi:hypothetical protein